MKHDFNGDGKADLLVTSPWGLGLYYLAPGGISQHLIASNGTRFGSWLLNTADNNTELKADLDGDGRAELLMSSPWGIGVLKMSGGKLTSIAMAQNGTRHGGWIINTADNQFLHAADFDRDGKEEVLVTSPWGLGILKYANNDIATMMLHPNGARFGEWLLNTGDNWFNLAGDFDGDGQAELLVTSPWGLGILKYKSGTLTSIVMAPNNTKFGSWTLNTATDRFEVAGDFNGDGKMEILVSNADKIAILQVQGAKLANIFQAKTGDKLGSWTLNAKTDKMNTVGDFDGDGKVEIMVSGNWGLGLLKWNGSALQSSVAKANGTRFDGWLLNTRDNRLNYAADFNGDGKSEVLISSPWGLGILQQSGSTFKAVTMSANGTRFGDWLLNTVDNDWEAGLGQSYGLIIYHSQWQWAVANTNSFLRNRGYTMYSIDNADKGIAILKNLALYLKASDRLFVYIAGHGGSNRPLGNTNKNLSLQHILQFEDGKIVGYDQFAPSFELLANKGVDLSVLDGSCDGGESVLCAQGERYLAMSTATVYAPGLTNTPDPSDIMKLFGKPFSFGMWHSQTYAASLLTSKTPHRFHQKIFRNDNTEINIWSLFYKPAIAFYTALGGGWDLMVRHCYLYRYIYEAEYNGLPQNEKDLMTGSTADYLAWMRTDYNAHAPSIAALRNILKNATVVDKAAQVYKNAYPRPWQTIFGDMNWNVTAEPMRHSSMNNALVPGSYTGTTGFKRMVNEVLNLIALLEYNYGRQEQLLKDIDTKILMSKLFTGIFKKALLTPKKITDYLKYNEYEQKRVLQMVEILNRVQIDRTQFYKTMGSSPETLQKQKKFNTLIEPNLSVIRTELVKTAAGSSTLSGLIADLKSLMTEIYVNLDKLFYLLIIVEEAVSRVQEPEVQSGDLVKY